MNYRKKINKQDLVDKVSKCNLSPSEKLEIIKIIDSSGGSLGKLIWRAIQMANLSDKVFEHFVDD